MFTRSAISNSITKQEKVKKLRNIPKNSSADDDLGEKRVELELLSDEDHGARNDNGVVSEKETSNSRENGRQKDVRADLLLDFDRLLAQLVTCGDAAVQSAALAVVVGVVALSDFDVCDRFWRQNR